ncbi:MAG: aspartate carbamoyltransferase [Candidatus Vogelbacteria bacterium]|nr:aspartate carbamoyltransferase [Candidatus Vogelbacteria bacterium]
MPNFRHIVRTQDFDLDWLRRLYGQATRAEEAVETGIASSMYALTSKMMITLFYQPSTRTRFSFETAMRRMGGMVTSTENARDFSSAAKGETPEDTIRVVAGYGDLVVVRHYEEGIAARMAGMDVVPVINAGDGPGQHPTQALLDLWTIKKERGHLDGLTVALMGDLKYGRTIHSLIYLLAKYKPKMVYLISPPELALPTDIVDYLNRHQVPFQPVDDVRSIADMVDVLYQTRVQKEYFGSDADYFRVASRQIVDDSIMRLLSDTAIVMHPLPRVGEIDPAVDSDPRAAYFRQAHNGLFVRIALVDWIFGGWD